jgi:hypothetical protein
MRHEHITDLLDATPVARLGDAERSRVEAHARECAACARAYDAARLASGLVAARARESVEPSPFFRTRVMAAVRERNAAAEENGLARMWRAARTVVLGMAASVVLLASAAVVIPLSSPQPPAVAVDGTPYSADLNPIERADLSPSDLTDEQLVAILYESEDIDGQGR